MSFKDLLKENKTLAAIALFFSIYFFVYIWKPKFLFQEPNNLIRDFGVGYKNKTILPLWLFSILLGIICYFIIVFYTNRPSYFM